jgi:hypothetical protein
MKNYESKLKKEGSKDESATANDIGSVKKRKLGVKGIGKPKNTQ